MTTNKNTEAQWQAQMDARTLAEYQDIIKNKSRLSAAQKAATKMAKEYQTKADSMKKALGGKLRKK